MTDNEKALRAACEILSRAVYQKVKSPVWEDIYDAWRLARDVGQASEPAEVFRFRTRLNRELLKDVSDGLLPQHREASLRSAAEAKGKGATT